MTRRTLGTARAVAAAAAALLVGALVASAAQTPPPPPAIVTAGPRDCPRIALTFDLCPASHAPGFEDPLVQFLIARQVPATFFPSGRWMSRHPAPLHELATVSFFELGTHGTRHLHLAGLAAAAQRAEIGGAIDLLATRLGRSATLFRPPYGEYDRTTLAVSAALGQRVVLWDVVSGDPSPAISAARMWAEVESQAKPGSIVIFHANGNGHHTLEVVTRVVDELAPSRGWQLVTVSELLAGCGSPPLPEPPSP